MKTFFSVFLIMVTTTVFAKRVPLTSRVFSIVNEEEKTDKLRLFVSEKIVSTQYSKKSDADIDRGIDWTTKETYYKDVLKKNRAGAFVGFTPDKRIRDAAHEVWVSFDGSCTKESCAYKFTREGNHKGARFYLTRVPDQKRMRFGEVKKGARAYLKFDQRLVRKIKRIKNSQGGFD
jgi:hypothetical protein